MVTALIATHGKLAQGLVDSINLIMGEQDDLVCMSLEHDTDIEAFGNEMAEKIRELDQGSGVIVFADLFLASPYNQAALKKPELSDVDYRVITGVNLPMLLEFAGLRGSGDHVSELWEPVMNAGRDGIKEFVNELEKFDKGDE